MKKSLRSAVLVAVLGCFGAAHAATFDYTFQDNVTDPGFSINHIDTIATERLSAPFATLTVADEDGGIRLTYASQGILDGKVSGIAFKYLPAFQQGLTETWSDVQPSNGGAYFFTDYDTAIPYMFIGGYGIEYSSEDQILTPLGSLNIVTIKEGAVPASFVFSLDPSTLSDAFTMHMRGLPSDVTAASLAPQYVRAVDTSYGKMPDVGSTFGQLPVVGRAVILASPVPESSTTAQMLLGMLAVGLVSATRRLSRPMA
jgi:hypothetical protein